MTKLTKALFALVFAGALAPCCLAEEAPVKSEEVQEEVVNPIVEEIEQIVE